MIQVTLNANEFKHSGKHNDREYTSLRVDRTSNGRVYFTTINNGIRLSTMAKQMQLIDGQVIISFGKEDKLIIGTYVVAEAPQVFEEVISEDTQETNIIAVDFKNIISELEMKKIKICFLKNQNLYIEDRENNLYQMELYRQGSHLDQLIKDGIIVKFIQIENHLANNVRDTEKEIWSISDVEDFIKRHFLQETPVNTEEKTLVDTYTTNEYKIELFSSLDKHNHKAVLLGETIYKYHVTFTDNITGLINHELSDFVYLSLEAALKGIKLYIDNHTTMDTTDESTLNKTASKPKQTIIDSIPDTHMLADYANILIDKGKVSINYTNNNQEAIATFKYRKSWSMRKYIDYVFNNSNIKPSWEFKYGWEYLSK
ncbi:hypothetical protein [Niallia circulans]|uniref:hypothetical protein n=1 Tax=Niallia circulans TaxID=1397 RepID=UPI001595DF3F|nr:hypothetical protein [Niallia circulans]